MDGDGATNPPKPSKRQLPVPPRLHCLPRYPTVNSELTPKGKLKDPMWQLSIVPRLHCLPRWFHQELIVHQEGELRDTRSRARGEPTQWQDDQEGGKHLGITAILSPPKDVNTLERSHHHSITNWKIELRSLKRSMYKAGTEGTGPPEFPSLPPEEQTARWGSGWPHTAGSVASSDIVTSETLAEKISRLRQVGGAYKAARKLCSTGNKRRRRQ